MPDAIKPIEKVYYNSTRPKERMDFRWWQLDESEQYQSITSVVKAIQTKQIYQSIRNMRHARLYANLDILSLQQNIFSNSAMDVGFEDKMSLNVVKSCIDTAASKIAKMRPRPLFLTEDGDWALQRRAEQLTKFIDGSFDAMNYYQKSQKQFVDAGVWGSGFYQFYIRDNEQVDCERVISEEIITDDADAACGSPMQMFRNKLINRDVLISMYPEHEAEIISAQSVLTTDQALHRDQIKITYAWRLPSRKGAKDGAYAVIIQNKTLESNSWDKAYFPFTKYDWTPKLTGYLGMGLAEELLPIQLEINKVARRIQRAFHVACVPRVWLDQNSQVNSQHITNEEGMIGKYRGQPPIFSTANAMPPEAYNYLESLYSKAFEITGVSQMNATAQKPAGLNSGEAQRVYQDITSERFQLQGMRWEDTFMDAADITIDLTKDLAAKNPKLEVKLSSGKHAETIRWKDVQMDKDQYVMRKFPTSILPTEPAGRLQKVQELSQAGMIDKDTTMSLLDIPDLEGAKSIQLETMDLTKKILGNMLDKGIYMSPEPYMDPVVAQKIAQAAYLKGRNNDVPDERLELLRRFMQDCEALKTLAAQGQMQAQGGMPGPPPPSGGPPLAAPMAPPQSDLLPNAPGQVPA